MAKYAKRHLLPWTWVTVRIQRVVAPVATCFVDDVADIGNGRAVRYESVNVVGNERVGIAVRRQVTLHLPTDGVRGGGVITGRRFRGEGVVISSRGGVHQCERAMRICAGL